MNATTQKSPLFQHPSLALAALSLLLLGLSLAASNVRANADGFYTGSYDYGGEAVHLFVEVDQRGPETLNLRRILNREHRIDTSDYILLAVVVDNRNATNSGFARLSVGGHKGPNVDTLDFQTRLLAPADERRNWKLYLSRDASITGFTAILAPRAYSAYRGQEYGYYDRGYLNNGSFYGWIWRDRYYQHPRGHRFYDYGRGNRSFGRGYDPRFDRGFNRNRDRYYRDRYHRDRRNQRRNQRRDENSGVQQGQRPARPGFGDRNIYEHERGQQQRQQRGNRDQRLRGNHEYRGERRNARDRLNRERRSQQRRATGPSPDRARAAQRQQRQQARQQQPRQQRPRQQRPRRSEQSQARAQRRPQLNKQRTTRRADQVRQRSER